MRLLTCDPELEVIGATMLSIIDNIRYDEIAPYLMKHNLVEITPDRWYPAQAWLHVMNDLLQNREAMFNLVAIGMEVAKRVGRWARSDALWDGSLVAFFASRRGSGLREGGKTR